MNGPVDETEYPVALQQGVYPDWKASYKALMRELMENSYGVDGYYLYDVDKDGIPEITVEFGDCEANYGGWLYTFDGEKAVYAGEFHLGHSGLATCPSQNRDDSELWTDGRRLYEEDYFGERAAWI